MALIHFYQTTYEENSTPTVHSFPTHLDYFSIVLLLISCGVIYFPYKHLQKEHLQLYALCGQTWNPRILIRDCLHYPVYHSSTISNKTKLVIYSLCLMPNTSQCSISIDKSHTENLHKPINNIGLCCINPYSVILQNMPTTIIWLVLVIL